MVKNTHIIIAAITEAEEMGSTKLKIALQKFPDLFN
jgi:hypothetical protein